MVQGLAMAIASSMGLSGIGASLVAGGLGLAFGVGASFLASSLLGGGEQRQGPSPVGPSRSASRTASIRQPLPPRRLVYGAGYYGGPLVWWTTYGSKGQVLAMVNVLAAHEVEAFGSTMIVNGQKVTIEPSSYAAGWYEPVAGQPFARPAAAPGPYLLTTLVDGSQTAANASLVTAAAKAGSPDAWTAAHVGHGVAYAITLCEFKESVFDAVPSIRWGLLGAKVYDPRTDSLRFTNNAALCAAHYLEHPYGLAQPRSAIDLGCLAAAANVCDEQVAMKAGGTMERYFVNGHVDADETPRAVLERFAEHMAGAIFQELDGSWRIHAGAHTPSVMSLGVGDFAGPLKVRWQRPRDELFNRVRATFTDADTAQPTEATRWPPAGSANIYEDEDAGRVRDSVLDLPWVRNDEHAQRLEKIHLEQHRQQIAVDVPVKRQGLALEGFDVVDLTVPDYGWAAKPFRVVKMRGRLGEPVDLTLVEHGGPAVYAWNEGEVTTRDPAPDSFLARPVLDTAARSRGASILPNADFADGLAGWSLSQDGASRAVATGGLTSAEAVELIVQAAGETWIESARLPIEAARRYWLGGAGRHDGDTADNPALYVRARWFDADGLNLWTDTLTAVDPGIPGGVLGWIERKATITPPSWAKSAVIRVEAIGDAGERVTADDIKFGPVWSWAELYDDGGKPMDNATDAAPGFNLTPGGDAEDGYIGTEWFDESELAAPGTAEVPVVSANWPDGNPMWSPSGGYFSGPCWRVAGGDGTFVAGWRYHTVFARGGARERGLRPYRADDAYSFSAKIWTDSTAAQYVVSVLHYDARPPAHTGVRIRNFFITATPGQLSVWHDRYLEFAPDATTAGGNPTKWVRFALGLSAPDGAEIKADDFQVRELATTKNVAAGAVYASWSYKAAGDIGATWITVCDLYVATASLENEIEFHMWLDNTAQATELQVELKLLLDATDISIAAGMDVSTVKVAAGQTLQYSDAWRYTTGDDPLATRRVRVQAREVAGQSASNSQAFRLVVRSRRV